MDQEVAKTLSELEHKLQELERELTSIGHRDTPPKQFATPVEELDTHSKPPDAPGRPVNAADTLDGAPEGRTAGRLVDEAAPREGSVHRDAEARVEDAVADNAFGGPAVWGGEEVPAQAGATTERDWTVEVSETAYGEIPTPPSPADAPGTPSPYESPPRADVSPSSSYEPSPRADPSRPSPREPPLPPPAAYPPFAPAPPPGTARASIELAELERFRDKLTSAMDDLVGEYNRLLASMPAAQRSDG